MKELKISIKLIDVTHEEWNRYLDVIKKDHKISFTINKDTYLCIGNDDVLKDVLLAVDMFKEMGKTIIVNTGGL